MTEQTFIKLLRSGNFTIVYWDRYAPTIYKGKWDINKEYEKDEYETMNNNVVDFRYTGECGYLPGIVELLTKALKGKCDSI